MSEGLRERLLAIDWFSHCGCVVAAQTLEHRLANIRHVASQDEARKRILAAKGEDDELEVFNLWRERLANARRMDVRRWNATAEAARPFIGGRLAPVWRSKLPRELAVDTVLYRVEWQVMGLFLEEEHIGHVKGAVATELYLPLYEAGFLPCGWSAEVLKSDLLYY